VMPSNISWVRVNNEVYPQCSKCGAYPLVFKGLMKIEYPFVSGVMRIKGYKKDRYYLLECSQCGKVYVRKTKIKTLRDKAMKRWL